MSKSDNIKRAKLHRQRKKESGKHILLNEQLEKDKQILRDKAANDNIKIIDRKLFGRKEKISTVLLEMIKPILLTAQDEEDARGIVTMGVVAWNCGIIKQTKGEDKLRDSMKAFKSNEISEERKLLDEYISIKCNQYSEYHDFITDFQLSFERDGRMNFTVLTGVTNDIAKTLNN
ncbi:MAG: hypothetical protein U1C46_04800 [Bacteroidales bacterium]|nr:hypothetical protein [Bacteroidales bacterium]MDZ4204119.1 hypothetical protein [Bacteroidales bacterium]